MSSTSRVLRGRELASVGPIEWRDSSVSVPECIKPIALSDQGPDISPDGSVLEREAYQRGFAEGTAVGKQQAAGEVQPVLDRLAKTLAELSTLRGRFRRDAEKDLVKLSIAIARRVLHREVTIDPESIEGLIRVALDKLQSRELARVRVHPAHAAFMKSSFDRISNSKTVELIADPTLTCGDVLFETSHGTLDASIESQLSEIERGFADRLQR